MIRRRENAVMRAWLLDSYDGIDTLRLGEVPDLRPGCAGSVGLFYRLFEGDPRRFGDLTLLTIDGVATREEPSKLKNLSGSFPPVGLSTTGAGHYAAYCYWSVVDTWDNPSLCAADSFDVSGDRVRFQSRVTNRPDLLPIAAAIKHAQAHEYRAVLAYCRSASIARQIVGGIPEFIFADTFRRSGGALRAGSCIEPSCM